jgi:hypothetical protein
MWRGNFICVLLADTRFTYMKDINVYDIWADVKSINIEASERNFY